MAEEDKPPIIPASTSNVVPPKDICSRCAPRLLDLERKHAEELHKRHNQWKLFVKYAEEEAQSKHSTIVQELQEKLLHEQKQLGEARGTVRAQENVLNEQRRQLEDYTKKVETMEEEIQGWRRRFKTYEQFVEGFADLTASWALKRPEGDNGAEKNAEDTQMNTATP